MAYPKIISLLPAATEIVCALGLEQNLVGRSHECDYPESVKQLPICSAVKFASDADSTGADNAEKDVLSQALFGYNINKEQIRELEPDIILTQTQCEGYGITLQDIEVALANLLNKKARVVSLQSNSLNDILANIKMVAHSLGVTQQGEELLESLNERIDIIRHKLKFIADKPTVACIEWLDPLMLAGNLTPELVSIAGGNAILAESGKNAIYSGWDEISEYDPEIIIVMPCGFSIERTMKEVGTLLSAPGFNQLKAVKNNRVYIADGNHYFTRCGPRIVDSIEILAEIIYPKQFIFGYEGNGWIKFTV